MPDHVDPPYPCGDDDPRPHYYEREKGAWLVQIDRSTWAIVTTTPDGVLYINADLDELVRHYGLGW